jgi:hypothetical protein
MPDAPLFKKGDVAVLRHEHGGRVFHVHSVIGDKVTEQSSIESQQKYASLVWTDQLVPVKTVQAAYMLAVRLAEIDRLYQRKIRELEELRRQEFDAACKSFDRRVP